MPPKLTIEEMQGIASRRGGKCLSNKYKNNQSKLLWECSKGHQWEAIPTNIQKGKWCPTCYREGRVNIAAINLHS